MKCHSCKQNGISEIDCLANSVLGRMRCKKCNQQFSLNKLLAVVYLALEGTSTLFAALYSVHLLQAWPIIICIIFILFLRTFALPHLAIQNNKRNKFRPSKLN
jgi:hypothetical protein